jgi:plasmid stabilization system protein ParE
MAADLIVLDEAEQDIDLAYAWYEQQRPGLGEEFLSRVDACLQSLRRSPQMHTCIYQTFRRALVRKFPYAVFYEYADNTVVVYCVFHTSQDPEKWHNRLP